MSRIQNRTKSIHVITTTQKEVMSNADMMDPKTQEMRQALDSRKTHKHFPTLAEAVAKSSIYYIRHYYDGGKKLYPGYSNFDDEMRMVDKYFPYADGGPLLIDEVRFDDQAEILAKKHDKLVAQGFRHLVLFDKIGISEALLELQEVDKKCRGIQQSLT